MHKVMRSQVSKPVIWAPKRALVLRGPSILEPSSCSLSTSDLCRGPANRCFFDVCVRVHVFTQLGCEVTDVFWDGAPQVSTGVLESRAPLRMCSPLCNSGAPAWLLTPLCSSLPGAPQTWTSSSTFLWKRCYPSR